MYAIAAGFLVPYAIFFHTLSWLSYRKFET